MTILSQGDVAVVGWQPDTVDAFSVVLLVDVDTNHPIIFTEQSWTNGNNFGTGEGQIVWTPPSNLSAGTVVTFSNNRAFNPSTGIVINDGLMNVYINGTANGTVQATAVGGSGNAWSASSGGDQLFVLQGSVASPTLIWGTDFDDSASEGAWSGIPSGSSGTNSTRPANGDLNTAFSPAYIEVGGTTGNGNLFYSGTTSGTKEALQTAIADPANWTAQSSPFTTTRGADPFTSLSAMSVTAPGAAPTVDTNTASVLSEGGSDIVAAAELETNDADTADSSLTYTVTTTAVSNGTLWLDANLNGVVDGGETTLGLGGTFTQDDINNNRLRYQHDGSETTTDSFGFQVSDGTNDVTNQTFNFTVNPVNDQPVITGFQGDVSAYNELFGGPVRIEANDDVIVADADHTNFLGGSLTVSFASSSAEDQLTINNGGGVGIGFASNFVAFNGSIFGTTTGGSNGAPLVITFTSAIATPSVIADLIEALRYDNSGGDNPTAGARSINIVLNDGVANSATSTATVNVTAVNDNPSATGLPSDIALTEDTQGNIDLSAANFSDPDSNAITVTLTASEGVFGTPADGAGVEVIETRVSDTVITLQGVSAAINTYLNTSSNIAYTGAPNDNGDNTSTITLTANDGDGSGVVTLGTINLDIAAVDDPADAVDDTFTVGELATLSGADLHADNGSGADSDVEGDSFDVIEVNGNSASVGTQITLPSGALLTVNASGTFDYDPNGQFNDASIGTTPQDSFTYTVTGGDTATVTINVTLNDGDEVFNGTTQTGNFNGGPSGTDTVTYAGSAAPVTVNLANPGLNTGDAAGDTYTGIEFVLGSNQNDNISGTSVDDILDGGIGADTLSGGAGNDWYYIDNANDVINEVDGNGTADRVSLDMGASFTLAADDSIEIFTTADSGGTTNMTLIGNGFAQHIVGNNGDNVLGDGGGAGADTLRGRDGDDKYIIYNSSTQVLESSSQGTADRIYAGRDYVLDDRSFVEILTTTNRNATYSRDIEGNTSKQTIHGNEGRNVLGDGGGSAANGDMLFGHGGNDLYVVRNSGTQVHERAGEGSFDRVSTSVDYVLNAGSHVESMNTTSRLATSDLRLTGNELGQWIQGNGGNNRIDGKAGTDEMSGEGGNDTFVFSTALGANNIDTIRDFNVTDDQIELDLLIFTGLSSGGLNANAFVANTSGLAETADQRIIYDTDSGALFFDVDGTGATAAQQFAVLDDGLSLTHSDFVVDGTLIVV